MEQSTLDDIVEPPNLSILGFDNPAPAHLPSDSYSLPLNPRRPLWQGLLLGFGISCDDKLLEDRDHTYSFLLPSLLLPTHTSQSQAWSWGLGESQ